MQRIEYLSGFNVWHKTSTTVETLGGKPGKGATVDCVAQIFPVSSQDNLRALFYFTSQNYSSQLFVIGLTPVSCCCTALLKWKLLWLMIGGNSYLSSPLLQAKTF